MTKKISVFAVCIAFILSIAGQAVADRGITVKVRNDRAPSSDKPQEVDIYSKSYGLVIGIDDYTNGWPKLSSAVSDAKRVTKELSSKNFIVKTILNPTSNELTKAFQEFFIFRGEKKKDRLFVWFAGHGYTEDGEGYIIPKDAPTPTAGAAFRFKALSMRRFGEYVRQAKSNHVFTVFDSCFSGTIFSTQRSAPPIAITRSALLPVRQFLSSGDANQTVSDNGLFCKLFIRALRDEETADANRDGYLTGSELGMFLTDRVTNLSEASQTPRYGKLRDPDYDRGDYVFLLPRSKKNDKKKTTRQTASVSPSGYNPENEMWETVKNSENPDDFRDFIKSFPESPLVPAAKIKRRQLAKVALSVDTTALYIRTQQKTYEKGDSVVVEYANLPGNDGDWFTVIGKDKPDSTYGQYDYTYGSKKGRYVFKNLEPGDYEVRLYLDWPKGKYTVHCRYPFTVQ